MIDFNRLADGELDRLGFAFETQEETELFAALIQEELEVRVGEAVGRELTNAQLLEFDCSQDTDESVLWLEEHCPDYRRITRKVQIRLEDELMAYRSRIPGAVPVLPPELKPVSIEELDLRVRTYNSLKRTRLNTVGDIMEYKQMSRIPRLKERDVEEIRGKLWDLMGDTLAGLEPDYYEDGCAFRWQDDGNENY